MDALTRTPRGRLAAILLALAALLTLPAPADGAFRALKAGSTGKRVVVVQRALGLSQDGVFGPATKRAVKAFQRRRGLVADGIVGPVTWTAIRDLRARQRRTSSRPRSAGGRTSRSALVRRVQRRLGIPADGIFGPQTKAAVKRFQRRSGLTADGIVGPATWAALGYPGTSAILRAGRGGARRRGGLPAAVRRVIAAADRIADKPYKWGGGHARWNDTGYDCSGSVSYALHGGGLLDRPLDSSGLMSYGAAGRGRYITIYANPSHTYMVIGSRRFDTTGRSESGTRWSARTRDSAGYAVRHPVGF